MRDELEASYRRLLRLYPPGYRARREAEMLDVIAQSAPSDRTRASAGDSFDLARGAAHAWVRWIFLPDPLASRNVAALIAIALPLLHLGLATSVLTRGLAGMIQFHASWRWSGYLRFAWDWPAWLLWALAAVAVVAGKARSARLFTALSVTAYVLLLPRQYARFNPDTLALGFVWIATGLAQAALLSRVRVARGRAALGRWLPAAGLTVVAVGASHGFMPTHTQPVAWLAFRRADDAWAVVIVLGVALVLATRSATARAAVPVAGSLSIALVAFRQATLGAASPERYLRVLLLAAVSFGALRLLTSVAARPWLESRHD